MKQSLSTPEHILQALRRADGGTVLGEICCMPGVSESSFYRWRKESEDRHFGELLGVSTRRSAHSDRSWWTVRFTRLS